MKKMNLCVALLMANTLLFAQDPKYGLKAGVNFSTITNAGGKLQPRVNFGILSHIHVTPAFSLQPEVMYSGQGTNYSGGSPQLLTYLNIPLLLQYNFDNGFRLQGGPQAGFLLEAKQKINNVEYDQKSAFKTVDFSLPVGLSYLGYSGFGVDMRYNIGVSNIRRYTATSYRNSVLQFGLFYLFDHHHKASSSRRR